MTWEEVHMTWESHVYKVFRNQLKRSIILTSYYNNLATQSTKHNQHSTLNTSFVAKEVGHNRISSEISIHDERLEHTKAIVKVSCSDVHDGGIGFKLAYQTFAACNT